MTDKRNQTPEIKVVPANAEHWNDLETLFGPGGASGGCWCMFWRLKRTDFNAMKSAEKKAALRNLTLKNKEPGLLAYIDGQAVGWCSVGPRADFAALETSRLLKPIDDVPVWSIVCFFIAKPFRNQGVLTQLLRGAVQYARQHGAKIVEGYPLDMESHKLEGKKLTGSSGYMGISSAFRAAGFVTVKEVSDTQLIMRCTIAE